MASQEDAFSGVVDPTLTPLRQALRDCKSAIYFMAFLSFVITVLSVAPILYMMNVFDRVIPTNSHITLVSLLTLVIVMYFFWSALEWLRKRVMVRISLRIDWDMAANVFDACFKKSLQHKDPNVHQVMGDLLTVRQFMTGPSVVALIDAPFSVIFLAFGYLIHPWLAGFIIVATLLLVAITLFTRKVTTPAIQAATQHNNEANRMAAATLKNAESALAMGMLPALRMRWHSRHRNFLQYQVNSSEANGFIGMIGGVLNKALPTLQITVGVMLAGAGLISVGGVIAAGFIMSKAIGPLRELIEKWEDIVKARMAYDRLDELMSLQQVQEEKMSLPAPQGLLVLDSLRVKAPGSNREILKGLNLSLQPGEVLAVAGPNAAGKSTLLKTILGLWKPSEGFARLDGAEVCDWNHEELGPHVGYVAQKPDLFEATVAENIARLGEVDADKVVAAAQLVGIHDIVLGFPEGYDTVLCTGEFELSVGQAQRLAITRAVYNNPSLLVLDEPNAALDEVAEQQLADTILAVKARGGTVVFTSHRPKLLAVADKLLVLKDGNQVAFGPSAELLGTSPPPAPITAKPVEVKPLEVKPLEVKPIEVTPLAQETPALAPVVATSPLAPVAAEPPKPKPVVKPAVKPMIFSDTPQP